MTLPEGGPPLRVSVLPHLGELAALHAAAFGYRASERAAERWERVLSRSLCWVTAHREGRLGGFVNVAWDGGQHAFLLDTAVLPALQGQGLGRALVERATAEARACGAAWLHVDSGPEHEGFYRRCGFGNTVAGLIRLR